MSALVGQQWGSYRLVRLLGRGGFAEVYLGEHVHLKTQAAVKILHTHLFDEGAEAFLREAQVIAQLTHPHIVRVLDFDLQEQCPFLVLEYAPNGSLRQQHPLGEPIPLEQVLSYVKQVAEVLQYAHEQHLIHRDVKPANMLLGRQNEVLLGDFGIVTMAHSTASQQTDVATGTIVYMAPEQIEGHPCPASDQYSLAIVAYQWLTGVPPFQGSNMEIVARHLAVPPPPLRDKVPGLPEAVEEVILTALAKKPDERFVSVQAFASALEKSSKGRVMSAAGESHNQHAPSPVPADATPVHLSRSISAGQSQSSPAKPVVPIDSYSRPIVSRRTLLIGSLAVGGLGLLAYLGTLTPQFKAWQRGMRGPLMQVFKGHQYNKDDTGSYKDGDIETLLWSPDSQRILSAGTSTKGGDKDRTFQIWDSLDGTNVTTYRMPGIKDTLHISWEPFWAAQGPRLLWMDYENIVYITDVLSGKALLTYRGHYARDIFLRQVAISPDGRLAAGVGITEGSDDHKESNPLRVWSAVDGRDIVTLTAKWADLPGYASGSGYEYGSYNKNHAEQDHIAWAPDSQRLVSWGGSGLLHVWNVHDGSLISSYTKHWEEHKAAETQSGLEVVGVAWSPDGTRILSRLSSSFSSDASAHIWEADSGRNVATLSFSGSEPLFVWSPDGQFIATSFEGKGTTVWAASGSQLFGNDIEYVGSLAWSPDGKRLAVASGSYAGEIVILETDRGQVLLKHAQTHEASDYWDSLMAWSPDGKYIAVTTKGGTVQIWSSS
jgi:eukaryotic-like serine/threonine-protein kinase